MQQQGQEKCVVCAIGRFTSDSGAVDTYDHVDDCKPCELGKFAANNNTETCDLCPAGYYQDVTGLGEWYVARLVTIRLHSSQ